MIQGRSIFKIRLQSWVQNPDKEPPDPFGTAYPVSPIIKNSLSPVVDVVKHSRDIYFGYSTNVLYQACQKNVRDSNRGALVDRGDNGGLAGIDVRAIHVSSREVDVQGIDNHQLINIPIVTAAGVIDPQKGPAVLIMNQYAHVKHGKTIHSVVQIEANGLLVDDCAITNGGHQCIITQGGYIIPL